MGAICFRTRGPDAGVRGALPLPLATSCDCRRGTGRRPAQPCAGNQIQVQISRAKAWAPPSSTCATRAVRRQISLTLDQPGQRQRGRWRTQLGVEQGNALGLMDTLALGLTTSRDTNASTPPYPSRGGLTPCR